MKKEKKVKATAPEVISVGKFQYLPKSAALVVTSSESIAVDSDVKPIEVEAKSEKNNPTDTKINFVPWGARNNTPNKILEAITPSITVGSNVAFNAEMIMGEGVKVYKRIKENGKIRLEEQLPSEQPDVFAFLEENDCNRIIQEWANDVSAFKDAYAEFIFNDKNKIVSLSAKEVVYSRVSQMNESGQIKWHGYSYKWPKGTKEPVAVTRLLSDQNPLRDLKVCRGILPNEKGTKEVEKRYRYTMSLYLPTPGRLYYMNPAWWAIFSSGWYDIAQLIPKAKKALMTNKFQVAYTVYIRDLFWEKLFKTKKATDEKEQKKVQQAFLQTINDFLAGAENAGKSFVSEFSYEMSKGVEQKDIIITPLGKSTVEGGDWIEDNEEATNMMCYSMGIHPSLIGASPGKNKSINGTEARELFIIKQSMQRATRKRLLQPLDMIKVINGWDEDLVFEIPNIMLTTLDKGTGAVKSIGNQEI
jgi:hypothetical protein